jgi:hypothetical protein
MIPSNQNWSCRVILPLSIIFCMVACVKYSEGLRGPESDYYFCMSTPTTFPVNILKIISLITDKTTQQNTSTFKIHDTTTT